MHAESLAAFCDLAETGSFTRAAQLNGVTQSAASQTLSVLEGQFRSLLIDRSKHQLRLTAAGEVLSDFGKRILKEYEDAQSKIQEVHLVLKGNIHVASV